VPATRTKDVVSTELDAVKKQISDIANDTSLKNTERKAKVKEL